MIELLLIMLWAATVENIIFTRALGSGQLFIESSNSRSIFSVSILLTVMMTVASLLCTPLTALSDLIFENTYLGRPFVMVVAITLIYTVIALFLNLVSPHTYNIIASRLSFACFNGALLGCVLIMQNRGLSFVQQLGFGLGGAFGFILAIIIVREGERRIAISRVPKIFKGYPALLIYLGLVSLAVFSLLGHQLPA
ncbi:MAG: hypothetical protein IJF27_00745 [Oscillospiraceae bacterium]|nr:hypothetical protein [Oscillospiraceae bacterium]MBQ3049545.1 hypothetical protein [Oscillospiraceae bacterium]